MLISLHYSSVLFSAYDLPPFPRVPLFFPRVGMSSSASLLCGDNIPSSSVVSSKSDNSETSVMLPWRRPPKDVSSLSFTKLIWSLFVPVEMIDLVSNLHDLFDARFLREGAGCLGKDAFLLFFFVFIFPINGTEKRP
jgi:hypothetical protein